MREATPEEAGLARPGEIALRHQHLADLVVGHRQVALPAGIAKASSGESVGDGAIKPGDHMDLLFDIDLYERAGGKPASVVTVKYRSRERDGP
jgi:hypothetical protein